MSWAVGARFHPTATVQPRYGTLFLDFGDRDTSLASRATGRLKRRGIVDRKFDVGRLLMARPAMQHILTAIGPSFACKQKMHKRRFETTRAGVWRGAPAESRGIGAICDPHLSPGPEYGDPWKRRVRVDIRTSHANGARRGRPVRPLAFERSAGVCDVFSAISRGGQLTAR